MDTLRTNDASVIAASAACMHAGSQTNATKEKEPNEDMDEVCVCVCVCVCLCVCVCVFYPFDRVRVTIVTA